MNSNTATVEALPRATHALARPWHSRSAASSKPRLRHLRGAIAGLILLLLAPSIFLPATARAEPLLPRHMNAATVHSIQSGLDYLAKAQGPDGGFPNSKDSAAYPVAMASLAGMAFLANGNTPTRGPYAPNVRKIETFLLNQARSDGLIAGPAEYQGRSMHAHGFALLFLASAYGMEDDARMRERLRKAIIGAIKITSEGQSPAGGWTYVPGAGDEGSVTVTQMQGLRAAENSGFNVPKATVAGAIKYLEACKTSEGGICYSLASRGQGTRLPISAAAIATLYNAGEYDSPLAKSCLAYVVKQFDGLKGSWSKNQGHDYYTHLYASQAFYQAGDKYWDGYFPGARDQLLALQNRDTGEWEGDGIGPVYGTSIALIILQLPYKFLPIYQR